MVPSVQLSFLLLSTSLLFQPRLSATSLQIGTGPAYFRTLLMPFPLPSMLVLFFHVSKSYLIDST